ncbi:hypothetical protein IGI04_008194 [Brassica rapa subsp. trilocularis]|uniref:Uncharacterized protein n=1 Tax=Brassica rapa subsp. trilocularis TaxID=1813537 RepID=A0ABQ7NLW4_BRACM|nr:hypothetical protein IGI04_008194 [Brassica rapa subsp. trilocularis]
MRLHQASPHVGVSQNERGQSQLKRDPEYVMADLSSLRDLEGSFTLKNQHLGFKISRDIDDRANPWLGNKVTCKERTHGESQEAGNSVTRARVSLARRFPLPETLLKSPSLSDTVNATVSCGNTTMHGLGSCGFQVT